MEKQKRKFKNISGKHEYTLHLTLKFDYDAFTANGEFQFSKDGEFIKTSELKSTICTEEAANLLAHIPGGVTAALDNIIVNCLPKEVVKDLMADVMKRAGESMVSNFKPTNKS